VAELVNLRQVRKRKARADKERAAAENRARFGRAKDEEERARRLEASRLLELDRHRRQGPTKPS